MKKKLIIIAEAGVNHNGDIEIAKKLIESTGKNIDSTAVNKILENYCSMLPDSLKNGVVEPIGNIDAVLRSLKSFESPSNDQ